MTDKKPNIGQQRFGTIANLGNEYIYTLHINLFTNINYSFENLERYSPCKIEK